MISLSSTSKVRTPPLPSLPPPLPEI
jgi:hypothetical protein